jgi:hypothetical protein
MTVIFVFRETWITIFRLILVCFVIIRDFMDRVELQTMPRLHDMLKQSALQN